MTVTTLLNHYNIIRNFVLWLNKNDILLNLINNYNEMDLAGRVCNLECVEREPHSFEFVGPVKIVLVNPPKKVYRRKTCGAAFLSLANMMIFASVMVVLYYSLDLTKRNVLMNLHIFLCTVGVNVFYFYHVNLYT